MDAERIEVFHVADRDTIVVTVADYFVFYLFPAFQTLLYQDLWRERECFFCQYIELFLIVAEARAQSAESISCTDNDRISQLFGCFAGIFYIFYRLTLDSVDFDFVEFVDKEFAVFSVHDGLNRST